MIVTYNRKDKLQRCIEAVLDQNAKVQLSIYVVDNNSSDGTEAAVIEITRKRESYKNRHLRYFNLRYNSGGAGGFCFGVRKALEDGADFLWLMDDDCIPEADALEEFLKFDSEQQNTYGFLSGKAIWKDGSLCQMNIQRETVFRNLPAEKLENASEPVRVEMASFVSLFIPAKVAAEAGLPIREFFIWTDDWEYTRRISRKYPCWAIPSSVVLHDTAQNAGADISTSPDDRIGRFRYLYRNDVYLYRREGIKGAAYEVARLALHTARILRSSSNATSAAGSDAGASKTGKIGRIGIMLKGTLEGLRFYPVPDRALVTPETDCLADCLEQQPQHLK